MGDTVEALLIEMLGEFAVVGEQVVEIPGSGSGCFLRRHGVLQIVQLAGGGTDGGDRLAGRSARAVAPPSAS